MLHECTDKIFQDTFNVNARGPMLITQSLYPKV